MNYLKKHQKILAPAFFFAGIFYLSIPLFWNYDIWFDLKSGEIFSKYGVIFHDVFAYTTAGRTWYPFEWLFQVLVYYIKLFLGVNGINIFTAAAATLTVFLVYKILRKIFNLKLYLSLLLSFLFYASTQEFYPTRPQILAYIFLLFNLYLILNYFFKGKNLLWLTIPITLAWANLHGSIFLDIAFFAGFALVSLVNYFLFKEKTWIKKFWTLAIYIPITFIFTILPPLGFTQYKLLLLFYQNRTLITRFISEWAPLSVTPFSFYLYMGTIVVVTALFLYLNVRSKSIRKNLWVIVFIPLIFAPFAASRNNFYGYLALTFVAGNFLSKIKLNKYIITLLLAILAFHVWMTNDKRNSQVFDSLYYPVQAVKFIKNYKLQGNMFNEYGFGGYFLYELYPEQKVYIDGRTDLYLEKEMPETLELAYKKNLPDDQYKKILDDLWNKNNISFVEMRTQKNDLLRKIARILQDDPNWSLVFWDDATQIFVRRDGKNDNVIKQFGVTAATPYNKDPYRKDQQDIAFREYQRMMAVADSSKSRNAIGYIELQRAQFGQAKEEFQKAIQIYPYNESPYMNLAELAASARDYQGAIKMYQRAQALAPDRGLIYIRLGQLIMTNYGDREWAKTVWKQGIANTIDSDAKAQLMKLLDSLNN